MGQLLDARGAAAFLGISMNCMYGLVARRKIPFARLPAGEGDRATALRFDPAVLEAWVFEHSVKPEVATRKQRATSRTAVA